MSTKTLTLSLNGNVPFDLFTQTMQRFQHLVDLLTKEVSRDAGITWVVDDLLAGSAIVTIRGDADQPEAVERVGRAYAVVGHALQQNEVIPYSPQIGQAAKSITQVLNGQITSIEFEANNEVATVMTNDLVREPARLLGAWGAIEGTVETLTSRRRLGFTLYDALNDKAVSCHLTPEQTELIRPVWGHHVLVRGWINRDPASGRPITIKPVRSVDILPNVRDGSYRQARAIAPASANDLSPEVRIRQIRDA